MSTRSIDIDILSTLTEAADKWANELSEFVIPEAAAADAAGYTDELERTITAVESARRLYAESGQ